MLLKTRPIFLYPDLFLIAVAGGVQRKVSLPGAALSQRDCITNSHKNSTVKVANSHMSCEIYSHTQIHKQQCQQARICR